MEYERPPSVELAARNDGEALPLNTSPRADKPMHLWLKRTRNVGLVGL